LTLGQSEYAPIPNTNPPQYTQQAYTANLLSQIVKANSKILAKMQISQKHELPIPIQANISLDRFALLGVQNPDIAWPIFLAFWKELTAPQTPTLTRPPIFFSLDNISHVLTDSHYTTMDSAGKINPIHAHDFVQIKHFLDHFSGEKTLPNGGIVMAATSESDRAKSPALDVSIAMAEARLAQSISPSDEESAKQIRIEQFWSPYKKIDARSLEVLKKFELMKLEGLTREEARTIIEYWASSGMVRRRIEESFVNEKWTVAGRGVVGELERAVVRRV
jgi:small subunit ribosomal protein S29